MSEKYDIIGAILSSSLVTWFIGWLLGRKKEDIEVALKYQEYYQKHIDDLKLYIDELTSDIDELTIKVQEMIDSDKQNQSLIEDQRDIIDNQRKTILRWEENSLRLENIVNEERKQNTKLINKLRKYDKSPKDK